MSSILVVPGSAAYLAGLRVVRESTDCLTHVAALHHPVHGPGRYFVKHYLDGPRASKGVANEACGYILGGAAQLSVPDRALILALPRERIAEMHPTYAARLAEATLLAWATSEVEGQALQRSSNATDEAIRGWRDIGSLIAFDSWVAIPDRSVANLVRRGREFVVIDHGHLGGSVFWEAATLPASDESRHGFLSLWSPDQAPSEVNQRIIVASERHEACFTQAEAELNKFLPALLTNDRDRIALFGFLRERARSSPARMKRVLNLLT